MEAKLKQEDGFSIVNISGRLVIEHTQQFRKVCEKNFDKGLVIFNLENASFVGSTGIQHFIEAIKDVHTRNSAGLRVVCAKPEFLRIFSNLEISNLQVHMTEPAAKDSFRQPIVPVQWTEPADSDSDVG